MAAAAATDVEMKRLDRVYWYTLEFGLVEEGGAAKAFGAGLLSSVGELTDFDQHAELKGWNLDQIAEAPFDSEEGINVRQGRFYKRMADSFVVEVKAEELTEEAFAKSGEEGKKAVSLIQAKVSHVADQEGGSGVYRQEPSAKGN